MKKSRLSCNPVQLLTGKYGVPLLTLLNMGLVYLAIALLTKGDYLNPRAIISFFMTYYLLDYRVGFISRAFIGSILYLFSKQPSEQTVYRVVIATIYAVFFLFSLLQAQLAKRALLRSDHATLLLSYMFFFSRLFWRDTFGWSGLLDIFLTALILLFILCVERRQLLGYCLAPLFCVVGLAIHPLFFFAQFPVLAAILWFDMLRRGKPERMRVVLFITTCVIAAALFVYFAVFTTEAVRMDENALHELIHAKYSGSIDEEYIFGYLYRSYENGNDLSPGAFLSSLPASQMHRVLRALPVFFLPIVPFLCGCVYHMRRSGNRRIAYLGFIAPLAALYPMLRFSTDEDRIVSLCFLAHYMLLHYIATQTDDYFLPCAASLPQKKLSNYEQLRRKERMNRTLIACAIAGMACTFWGLHV